MVLGMNELLQAYTTTLDGLEEAIKVYETKVASLRILMDDYEDTLSGPEEIARLDILRNGGLNEAEAARDCAKYMRNWRDYRALHTAMQPLVAEAKRLRELKIALERAIVLGTF